MRTESRFASARLVVSAALATSFALPAIALGHAERPSFFPNPRLGHVPTYRSTGPALVVCKRDSGHRIRQKLSGPARRRNLQLLRSCRFRHIQAAVNAARSGYRILVLPGVYREEPSRRRPNPDPRCQDELTPIPNSTRPQPSYEYHRRCPNAQNLIAVVGDGPDRDRRCDRRCDLQIEGTGSTPRQVVIAGKGFGERGGAKYNLIRADRADGIYLRNFTLQFSDFNDVYVIETNGFRLERLVTRWSREYGVLSFASDHGLYDGITAYGNGDSGLYPGSGPPGRCSRYGIEIRRSDVHGNTTGIAGTAGNSVWMHHNRVHHNALGFFFDSLAPNHPGMPQNCSKWEHNRIHSNNLDLYGSRRDAYCDRRAMPIERRDPRRVCPAVPVPIGTGILLGGGNRNLVRRNSIYDNWRFGTMQFYAPPSFRGNDSTGQSRAPRDYDTSNRNAYRDNRMGVRPNGTSDPNGIDFWWDEEGRGNCWSGNTGRRNRPVTSSPRKLAACPRGNSFSEGDKEKQGSIIPCAAWNPTTNPDPNGCDWLVPPREPGRAARVAYGTPRSAGGGSCADHDPEIGWLAWTRRPILISPPGRPGDRIVTGRIENRSPLPLALQARQMHVQGRLGEPFPSSIAFLDAYVHSLDPADRDAVDDLPEAERERLGHTVFIAPGATAPLTVAWSDRSANPATAQIVSPAGSLPLPQCGAD